MKWIKLLKVFLSLSHYSKENLPLGRFSLIRKEIKMKNKRTQSEANNFFDIQLQNFEKFDFYNIFEVDLFVNLLKKYIEDAKKQMDFRYKEIKEKYQIELLNNLKTATDIEEAYMWCLATNENYSKAIINLEREIKQRLQEVFSSYAITNIGKLFVYIIIYKVRFSNVDESLKKIISDMRFKKDELVLLIKPSILNALIMCEEYSVEKKFPKHFNRAMDLLKKNVSGGFVPYEILCKRECEKYIKKYRSEFIEKVLVKIPEGEKRDIFDMYLGVTEKAKSFKKIAKETRKDISEIAKIFKKTAESLKAELM